MREAEHVRKCHRNMALSIILIIITIAPSFIGVSF
jgi:hypothetical protein